MAFCMCDISIRHAPCSLIHTLLFEPTQPPVLISPSNQTVHHHFSKIISLTVLTHVRYATHGGSMHYHTICHYTHVMTVVRYKCTRCDIIHSLSHIRTIAIAFNMLAYLHDISVRIASRFGQCNLWHSVQLLSNLDITAQQPKSTSPTRTTTTNLTAGRRRP